MNALPPAYHAYNDHRPRFQAHHLNPLHHQPKDHHRNPLRLEDWVPRDQYLVPHMNHALNKMVRNLPPSVPTNSDSTRPSYTNSHLTTAKMGHYTMNTLLSSCHLRS